MAAGGCCNRSGHRGFLGGSVGDLSQFGPLVRDARKARLQSSQLDLRARLVGSVRAAGVGCMAAAECKLSVGGEADGTCALLFPARSQRVVVGLVLRIP